MRSPTGYWLNGEWVDPPKAPKFTAPTRRPYVGHQWAYELAKEVEKYPDLVEARLYAQAQSYAKLGRSFENIGKSPVEAAELLAKNYRFSGWSKDVVFRTLFQLEPTAPEMLWDRYMPNVYDVQAGKYTNLSFGGEEFVKRWNREAQLNKYIKAIGWSQSFGDLMAQAERGGVGEEFRGRLMSKMQVIKANLAKGVATHREKNILAEVEAFISKGRVGESAARPPAVSKVAPWSEKALAAVKAHPLLATAAAATALYMLQPGGWFSGSDDNYNTIEGLPHGGEAEKMRRILTDFGSGWQAVFGGIKNLAKTKRGRILPALQKWVKGQNAIRGTKGLMGGVDIETGRGIFQFNKKEANQAMKAMGLGFFERRRMMPVIYAHEVSEMHHGIRGLKRVKALQARYSQDELVKMYEMGQIRESAIGSHLSSAVIADEALIAGVMGPKTFEAAKKFRFAELERVQKAIMTAERKIADVHAGRTAASRDVLEQAIKTKADLQKYVDRTRKIYSGVERKHLHRFDGWTEEGIAAIQRKNFGFGSPKILSKIINIGKKFFKRPVVQRQQGGWFIEAADLHKLSSADYKALLKQKASAKAALPVSTQSVSGVWSPKQIEAWNKEHVIISREMVERGERIPSGPELIKRLREDEAQRVAKMVAAEPKTGVHGAPTYEQMQEQLMARIAPPSPGIPKTIDQAGWHAKHKEAMVRAGTNATRPGKRHVQQTGKIVI